MVRLGLFSGITANDTFYIINDTPTQVGSDTDWTCVAAGGGWSFIGD
jgi:hypothetical protein